MACRGAVQVGTYSIRYFPDAAIVWSGRPCHAPWTEKQWSATFTGPTHAQHLPRPAAGLGSVCICQPLPSRPTVQAGAQQACCMAVLSPSACSHCFWIGKADQEAACGSCARHSEILQRIEPTKDGRAVVQHTAAIAQRPGTNSLVHCTIVARANKIDSRVAAVTMSPPRRATRSTALRVTRLLAICAACLAVATATDAAAGGRAHQPAAAKPDEAGPRLLQGRSVTAGSVLATHAWAIHLRQ